MSIPARKRKPDAPHPSGKSPRSEKRTKKDDDDNEWPVQDNDNDEDVKIPVRTVAQQLDDALGQAMVAVCRNNAAITLFPPAHQDLLFSTHLQQIIALQNKLRKSLGLVMSPVEMRLGESPLSDHGTLRVYVSPETDAVLCPCSRIEVALAFAFSDRPTWVASSFALPAHTRSSCGLHGDAAPDRADLLSAYFMDQFIRAQQTPFRVFAAAAAAYRLLRTPATQEDRALVREMLGCQVRSHLTLVMPRITNVRDEFPLATPVGPLRRDPDAMFGL